jgi:hypothetical protein
MRARKQSDSPTGYDREVRPRLFLDAMARQELAVRRANDRRWARRIDACLSTDMRDAEGWPGCRD